MTDRASSHEPLLDLQEEEGLEHLDSQVQRAQEQLLALKRQQEMIERQKRELEELSRRQEQLQAGRAEMIEQFTRAIVVVERETYDAQKRVEQLRGIHQNFAQHLDVLEAINPKNWENLDINKELNRALSAVDDARAAFTKSRAAVNAEVSDEVISEQPAASGYQVSYGSEGAHDFMYWLKSGLAFTLPLVIIGLVIALALFFSGK